MHSGPLKPGPRVFQQHEALRRYWYKSVWTPFTSPSLALADKETLRMLFHGAAASLFLLFNVEECPLSIIYMTSSAWLPFTESYGLQSVGLINKDGFDFVLIKRTSNKLELSHKSICFSKVNGCSIFALGNRLI